MENNKPSKRRKQPPPRYPLKKYKAGSELVRLRQEARIHILENQVDFYKKKVDFLEKVELRELPGLRKENKELLGERLLLKTENSKLKERERIAARMSMFQACLMLAATVMIGFGVNLITSHDSANSSSGELLLALGVLIGLCGIFSILVTGSRGGGK